MVRYPIIDPNPTIPVGELGPIEYKAWVRTHLDYIDTLIPTLCDCRGVLIPHIHTPPGGRKLVNNIPVFRMFYDRPWARTTLKDIWVEIAVLSLMRNTTKAIRTIDRLKPVIVSCAYGSPSKASGFGKVAAANVWYTIHMYEPLNVTHQGVGNFPAGKPYPGPNTGKARMVKDLAAFRKFCADHSVQGFLGEFSISTYADETSRANYMKDVIDLAESYGWNWCIHAFREAPVWNFEGTVAGGIIVGNWGKND